MKQKFLLVAYLLAASGAYGSDVAEHDSTKQLFSPTNNPHNILEFAFRNSDVKVYGSASKRESRSKIPLMFSFDVLSGNWEVTFFTGGTALGQTTVTLVISDSDLKIVDRFMR